MKGKDLYRKHRQYLRAVKCNSFASYWNCYHYHSNSVEPDLRKWFKLKKYTKSINKQ